MKKTQFFNHTALIFWSGAIWRAGFDMRQRENYRTAYCSRFELVKKVLSSQYEQSVAIISTECSGNDKEGWCSAPIMTFFWVFPHRRAKNHHYLTSVGFEPANGMEFGMEGTSIWFRNITTWTVRPRSSVVIERWTSNPKVAGSNPTEERVIIFRSPVWKNSEERHLWTLNINNMKF